MIREILAAWRMEGVPPKINRIGPPRISKGGDLTPRQLEWLRANVPSFATAHGQATAALAHAAASRQDRNGELIPPPGAPAEQR